jgi:hypothetical protein
MYSTGRSVCVGFIRLLGSFIYFNASEQPNRGEPNEEIERTTRREEGGAKGTPPAGGRSTSSLIDILYIYDTCGRGKERPN